MIEVDSEVTEDVVLSKLELAIVGIGASAGGMAALQRFFELMPSDSGMAFVVVLHLSPKHESHAAEILQKVTSMQVTQVTETLPIQANRVYVIPPGSNLRMNDDHLLLAPKESPSRRASQIDVFFRTLAQVHRNRAFAIVLTGSGADGSIGLTRIKEFGGVTLAQSSEDAEFAEMPEHAVSTGMVDIVLPVAEMPKKLIELWQNARKIRLPQADNGDTGAAAIEKVDAEKAARDALRDIMITLRARTGHDFQHYKRATVLRRLERRLQVNVVADLPAYRDFLQTHPPETAALLKDMLISVTSFFRDRDAFDALEQQALKPIFEGRESGDPVRLWCAGCATGEEAYSLSMLLREQGALMMRPPELHVFATDIDEAAIATARSGLYPGSVVTDVTPTRLRHFFTKEDNKYRVRKNVRENVLFARHNLLRDPPFSKLDLISCRNLLIYLDRQVQTEILEIFQFALRPGGYLLLGSSETTDSAPQTFTVVDKKHRIYRANPISRIGRTVPMMPLGSREPRLPISHEPAIGEPRTVPFAEIHQAALEQYAPPSVLIDRLHLIVHMSDRAGRFLRYVGGAPSYDLLKLVDPDLRLELRAALFQSAQTQGSIETRRVKVRRNGSEHFVNMIVRPLPEPGGGEYTLVIFDEVEGSTDPGTGTGDLQKDRMVQQLEEEVQKSKEQLQGIIEQSETTNEELKASNEELQAINEELRSATEELETSREELQSVNEELITVNYELKVKVEETGKINDDLQNLIASTEIATVFIDRAMRIQRYTPRSLELFNIIATDLGRPLPDITHRLVYPTLTEDSAEVLASLRPIEREVRDERNGRWYIARILPYRTTEDHIDGAVLTFIDISRLKQAEERIRASDEKMRLVAESTKDYAIYTLDIAGLVTSWNIGAERMFGYTESEMLGQPSALTFVPEDRDRGLPEAELRIAAERGRFESERWQRRKDGSGFFCSAITTTLGGERQGFANIARDMTLARSIESERETMLANERQARAEAQAAIALKDEFLAVMSHELKHPLNLIQVNAELLSRLPESRHLAPVNRVAKTIHRAVQSQAQIIDDMLDLTRMNTGKMTLNRQPVDWTALTEIVINAVQTDAAQLKLTIGLTPDSERLTVLADATRVEQIVWNLVSNAMKFSPGGGRIDIRLSKDGKFARFEVRDTGMGIRPEFIGQVFEMFRQADVGTTRKQGGLGIGLALVQQLARLHGGRVLAQSEGLGRGACFSVWLPLLEGEAVTAVDAPVSAETILPGQRVLLVDDNADSLEAFSELLTMVGATVSVAIDGSMAMKLLAEQDFDLVLSDIGMPEMDGYQLISAIRSSQRNSLVPAIAITGFGRQKDAKRALAAGFNAHLSKPISLDGLSAALVSIGLRSAGK